MRDFTKELSLLDGRRADMTETLKSWCDVNSGSRNLDGLAQMRDLLADAFARLGADVEIVPSQAHEIVTNDGRIVTQPVGDCLRIVKRPQAPVRVMLAGHMDTVFPKDHAFQSWRMIDADTMNAPGSADMKGGLLVMLHALDVLEQSSVADQIGFEVIVMPMKKSAPMVR